MSKRPTRRGWKILPAKHRKILDLLRAGVGVCKTAAIVGVGVRTVQRRVDAIRVMESPELEIDFRVKGDIGERIRKHTCPVHGVVTVWPCVACAAIAAKSTTLADPGDAGLLAD